MRSRGQPKECACGCGGMTRGGDFIPGHDSKLQSAIVKRAGGIIELRGIVEKALSCRIKVRMD